MRKKPDRTTVFEYDAPGDAEVLEMRTIDLDDPGPGEVTVEVVASGISHIDGFIRVGGEDGWSETWPRRSGSDFAGIVVARGADTTRFALGADVIGHVASGAHARHLNVPISALVAKPREVGWEVAGGLYLAGATALATVDDPGIGPADTVVISAAAGGVGSIEAQIAKHRGARVIGTCGERNFDYLRQLGIIPVRYGEGLADRIRHVARGSVTALIDNFGKDSSDLRDELEVPASRYRSSEDRRILELRLLDDDPAAVAYGTDLLARVTELARIRAFTPLISGLYPLASLADAYADLSRLHARRKVVVTTNPVTTVRTLKARDVQEAS